MVKLELTNYDIFPKVFPCDTAVEVTIKPLGQHVEFIGEYTIQVRAINEGNSVRYPERNNLREYTVTPCDDGCLRFIHTYKDEQEHYVDIVRDGKRLVRLSVYSLATDSYISSTLPALSLQ